MPCDVCPDDDDDLSPAGEEGLRSAARGFGAQRVQGHLCGGGLSGAEGEQGRHGAGGAALRCPGSPAGREDFICSLEI